MRAWCAAAWKRDEGQALVEYSLILALVAAGLVAVLLLFRDSVGNSYQQVGNRVDGAGLPVATPSGSPPGGGTGGGAGAGGGGAGGGELGYPQPGGAAKGGKGGKGDPGCGGGQGGGLGQGGGGGCGGGRDQ